MSQHFTHLHLHSEFSLLDGAISLDALVNFGKQQQFKSLAITDHGNIFGAVKFFQKCKKAGIKPILGMEAYFTEDVNVKLVDKKYYHLILLVQNEIGYKNLCKLISFSYQKGFYFKPRIDYAILADHCEGLIATTACLGGHIPSLLMQEQYEQADERVDWFLRHFGPERFYLEIQPEDQTAQKTLNQKLYDLSAKKNLQLIATGDCHYVSLADHEAHEVMLSIQTQHKITDNDRFSFGDCRAYIRTADQMLACFPEHPQAIWNSGVISDQCNFDFPSGNLFFPQFELPTGHTQESYFSHLCSQGLQQLIDAQLIPTDQTNVYWQRLELERDLIIKMGFVGYFLVVSDFIQWAKKEKIPVGPGRGSAAGSLVAWALQITNIDPIKYNLLFERFLNPERVSMPDIDIDFCIEGREAVIEYVRSKYGTQNVGQIITFGTMMAKGVIKDVARVLGIPFEDSNALSALIPDQLKITLKEAVQQEPKLQQLIDNNPTIAKLFDIAFRLEGLTRHASKHAAGIVISPQPIDEVLPVYVPSKSTELVTQYAMTELEALGFLKMDLLGLKNLTLINNTLKLIHTTRNITINLDTLALNDPATFALLCQGKTSGVFQFESDGIKEVLRKLQPEKFEDLLAVNALYRPGPLGSGMVEDFIERKHGRQKIVYIFPELIPILQETYGVIVYQEQVMKIASAIGGYSLGEADILRRAMGKKKAEVMAEQRAIFLEKSVARNFDAQKSGELFDLMAYFAGYGFNKSHSAAYALIAYHTAYLKANFPAEFMACLISLEATHTENMAFYVQEAKELNIGIIPPDINRSGIDFTVTDQGILCGLKGIKNVGLASLENIMQERQQRPFVDILDFCMRIDLRTSNKRIIENLIYAGALDCLPGNRAQKHEELPKILEQAAARKKLAQTGQMDLFGTPTTSQDNHTIDPYAFLPRQDWDSKTKLTKEAEVLGFYVSAHPLHTYQHIITALKVTPFNASTAAGQQTVLGCGIMKHNKLIMTKKHEKMSFLTLEDTTTTAEVVIFPKLYATVEPWLEEYTTFLVQGTVDTESTTKCKIKAQRLIPLDLVYEQLPASTITVHLPPTFETTLLEQLAAHTAAGPHTLHMVFWENNQRLLLKLKQPIALTENFLHAVHKLQSDIVIMLS